MKPKYRIIWSTGKEEKKQEFLTCVDLEKAVKTLNKKGYDCYSEQIIDYDNDITGIGEYHRAN